MSDPAPPAPRFSSFLVRNPGALLLVLSLVLQLFERYNYRHGYDDGDTAIFIKWSKSWSVDCREIITKGGANYPFVGLTLSAGVLAKYRERHPRANHDELSWIYKRFILCFDLFNLVLVAAILRLLGLRCSIDLAALVALLPSSWAGGAFWGQTDSIVHCFLLGSLLCLAQASLPQAAGSGSRSSGFWRRVVSVGLFGLSVALGLLTKQTFLFSVPGLAVFSLIAGALLFRHLGGRAWLTVLLGAFVFFATIRLIDSLVDFPSSYRTHLLYILTGPPGARGDRVTCYGLDIWALCPRALPERTSENLPFLLGVTYRKWGLLLGGLGIGIPSLLLLLSFRRAWRRGELEERTGIQRILAQAITCAGLHHFAINLFFTGVHERYLYSSYPLLLIGLLHAYRNHRATLRRVIVTMAFAAAYGAYVVLVLTAPYQGHWNFVVDVSVLLTFANLLFFFEHCAWFRRWCRE